MSPAIGGGIICGLALLGAARIILVTWRAFRRIAVAAAKALIAADASPVVAATSKAPEFDLDALAAKLAAILASKKSKKDEPTPTSEKAN